MFGHEIRTRFLEYFEQRGHLKLPSAPLIPRDDPSLLLINAGMVPFKPYFLGLESPPSDRVTSCQKAFRTVDIEEVGYSPSHDTFFEMLGNFSFGAYFKAEAIEYAFQLLTEDFALDPQRLHYTVHPSDLASLQLWQEVAGVPPERILQLEDNFWQAGPTGPCGVDSEIFYDLGPKFASQERETPGSGSRYLEVWNLVFMDSERLPDGTVQPLERPGVDTGMGLERIAMVLQGRSSIYQTDLFSPIMEHFAQRCPADSELPARERQRHLRILADHTRGACMLIGDGVLPGNEGRDYVLRRIIRRAALSGRKLGLDQGGLGAAVSAVARVLGDQYAELEVDQAAIRLILEREEARFDETLSRGLDQFELVAGRTKGGVIAGADAFRLYDTYGFSVELTRDLASSRSLGVDQPGFDLLLDHQRERARAGRQVGTAPGRELALPESHFIGYQNLEAIATVALILSEGEPVERAGSGERVEVVLDPSPFYAEGGGQVGDQGRLTWEGGWASVLDSQARQPSQRLELCTVGQGELVLGQQVQAAVDQDRRAAAAAHHSATHLLNAALRRVLGQGVVQRGSMVDPGHATFDFSWPSALGEGQLLELERLVNRATRDNLTRVVEELPLEEARRSGALALPAETYGDRVRVVSFGDFSRELCGGTHVETSGSVGAVVLLSERSVGSGTRRIELLAAGAAERWWEEQRSIVSASARALRSGSGEIPIRVEALQSRVRELERELSERRGPGSVTDGPPAQSEEVGGVLLAIDDLDHNLDARELRQHADHLLELFPGGCALVLAGEQLVVKLSSELVDRGLSAGDIAMKACRGVGGRGGGKKQLGQGGIPADRHRDVLVSVRSILESGSKEA